MVVLWGPIWLFLAFLYIFYRLTLWNTSTSSCWREYFNFPPLVGRGLLIAVNLDPCDSQKWQEIGTNAVVVLFIKFWIRLHEGCWCDINKILQDLLWQRWPSWGMSSKKDSRSVLVLLDFDEDPLEVVIYGLFSTIHETQKMTFSGERREIFITIWSEQWT